MPNPEQVKGIGQAVAENGRVLATLDDWRAMGFLVAILFLAMIVIIFMLLRSTKQERSEMSEERSRMWAVADKFGAAADKLTSVMQVQSALAARVESALGRREGRNSERD